MLASASTFAQSPITYQYAHDSAGRLTEAVDSGGNALVYAYDAAGNITSITKQTGVQTAIFGAADANGNPITAAAPGQQVTLSGIGLGDCPNVTVTVDGITATIVSKSTNTITFLIPAGASTGNIVVSTCHGSATYTLTIGSVTVTPPVAVLTPGQTFQFTASVLPATLNQGVTWSVEGIDGGDPSVGTITPAGLYMAPAGTGFVTIQATSVADPELFGTAQISVLASSDVYEAFSPGVSVLFSPPSSTGAVPVYVLSPGVSVSRQMSGSTGAVPVYVLSPGVSVERASSGGSSPTPVYAVSPGVSVILGSTGGAGTTPVYTLSPGVSVERASAGSVSPTPVYVLSPGVSVLIPAAESIGAAPVYTISPGVSVLVSPAANNPGPVPVCVLSPGVSVGFPPLLNTPGSVPVSTFSPGVSFQNGPRSTVGSGDNNNGTLFIVSPGVSVAPASGTNNALTPPTESNLPGASTAPPRISQGSAGSVTVRGTHLEEARAIGFVSDAGRLDPDITIQSAIINSGGQAMILHLSVRRGDQPGRRHPVFWTLPRIPQRQQSGVHFLP